MPVIYESTPGASDDWVRWLYLERCEAAKRIADRKIEYPIFGLDHAKPGSDRTAVFVWPEPPSCAVAEAAVAPKPETTSPPHAAPDTDRMWDYLVLAARTSRYGAG